MHSCTMEDECCMYSCMLYKLQWLHNRVTAEEIDLCDSQLVQNKATTKSQPVHKVEFRTMYI